MCIKMERDAGAVYIAATADQSASGGTNTGRIGELIKWLKSLRGGEGAIFALIQCGCDAVPALSQILHERDPSGIFEPRCRAVKALAGIGAHEVLLEFLSASHEEEDPVARLGEEAVVNAVARALIGMHTERFYELLVRTARRQLLPGVIEALADFRRADAIPILIAALAEDFSRAAAEEGLRKLGARARQTLIEAATIQDPSPDWESPSSLRRRRSALQLLHEIGIEPGQWARLRALMSNDDPALAFLACRLCLARAAAAEKTVAIQRLIAILPDTGWLLAREIEDCLIDNFSQARELVDRALKPSLNEVEPRGRGLRLFRTLQRVKACAEALL